MSQRQAAPTDRSRPDRSRRDLVGDESGITMVIVIGMAVVLILTAVVGLEITNGAIDRSSKHVTFESSAHLAEQGVDLALARLQQSASWATTASPSNPYPPSPTVEEEEAWALAELAVTTDTVTTNDGEWAVVRPPERQVIYAAGWMPSRAGAVRPRIFKAEYLFSTYNPPGAVLTGGALDIGGNATVAGTLGDVHSNSNITVVGGSLSVSGTVTASGTLTGGQAGWSGGQPNLSIPPISPRDIYDILSDDYASSWYDLCPDGVVRRPSGGVPCTGAVVDSTGEFRGFKHTTSGGKNVWKYSNSTAYDGVYYAYRSSIAVAAKTSVPWHATLIAEGAPTSGCFQEAGDIQVTGHPDVVGKIDGLTLVAGRDLEIAGNPSGGGESFQGLIAAYEQVKVTGTPLLTGAIVAGDYCQTAGSPVSGNYISGNMTVKYDGGLDTNLVSLIRTSLWLEL